MCQPSFLNECFHSVIFGTNVDSTYNDSSVCSISNLSLAANSLLEVIHSGLPLCYSSPTQCFHSSLIFSVHIKTFKDIILVSLKIFCGLISSFLSSLTAEASAERSPRRRSISGLGSSEKNISIDGPNSSPFKVPVSSFSKTHISITPAHHHISLTSVTSPSLQCQHSVSFSH